MIVLAPAGLGRRALDPVHRFCELGAETLIIGKARAVAGGTMGLSLDDLGTELPSPVLTILPLQLLAWHLARERQIDRDQPRTIPERHRDRQIQPDLRLSCVKPLPRLAQHDERKVR